MQTQDDSADDLQMQMHQVRSEMNSDVAVLVENARTIVAQAKSLVDWKHYLQTYPWTCLGAAAAAGFMVIPRRAKVVQATAADLAKLLHTKGISVRLAETGGATVKSAAPMTGSVMAPLVNLAVGMLMQRAANLVERQVTNFIKGDRAEECIPPHGAADDD